MMSEESGAFLKAKEEAGSMRWDWSGHQVLDPFELQMRFSDDSSMSTMGSVFESPTETDISLINKVRQIMESLPSREADFVELYYFRRLKQTDIAAIFRVSQPTVCYRLQRATSRIQYLLQLPSITSEELRVRMVDFLPDSLDVEIMVLMFETTCQSEVAKRMGVSQGLVRHRFIRSIDKMKNVSGMEKYVRLFNIVSQNLNILREVRRSSQELNEITYIID